MKFIADYHIHSPYSRATSKALTPDNLEYWANIKGLNVIGTGDCIHPQWLSLLKTQLTPANNGLYQLKEEFRSRNAYPTAVTPHRTFFTLTTEISSIYKKNGRVRKVHNICVLPDLEAAEKFQQRLARIGNIASDGRPILGLDAKNLLEILLETSEDAYMIPAHIWTPWFSILGSQSGFDSIEECFEDLTPHIFALETGLSSDPPMNRLCSRLDQFRLVSNSDAHSSEKLGREANIFQTALSYQGMLNALKYDEGFSGTIEFFPNEGKYHYDGHRDCGICWDPFETQAHDGVCPVCGKKVTIGVMYRVAQLADRKPGEPDGHKQSHASITSLPDLVGEINGTASSSKKAQADYLRLLDKLGNEFHILLDAEIAEIKQQAGTLYAEGIQRLREGRVYIKDGFDGEFGRITVFEPSELKTKNSPLLIKTPALAKAKKQPDKTPTDFDFGLFQQIQSSTEAEPAGSFSSSASQPTLNPEQIQAVRHGRGPCMVVAGPGTGKTKVLTERIVHLITQENINPGQILAITFSNKAATEITDRLNQNLPDSNVTVSTFHALGLSILKEQLGLTGRQDHFQLIDPLEKINLIKQQFPQLKAESVARTIEQVKCGALTELEAENITDAFRQTLIQLNAFDLDDLIDETNRVLALSEINSFYRQQYPWILVDEGQDINPAQYKMLLALAGDNNPNLFIIGDPDQAIYGFRGANPKLLDQLGIDLPELRRITLHQSYRCPANILEAAHHVLQKANPLNSNTPGSGKIQLMRCETQSSEADWIAAEIEKRLGGVSSFSLNSKMSAPDPISTLSPGDFAILCRSSHQFESLLTALANHGIPHHHIAPTPLIQQKDIAERLAIYKNCLGQPALLPPNADPVLVKNIAALCHAGATVPEVLLQLFDHTVIAAEAKAQLLTLAEKYCNQPLEFFRQLALRAPVDELSFSLDAVALLTIHAAKGLEFNTVFIPGCEEGLLPFTLYNNYSPEELEEEKRLLYVGMTRAKQTLVLSHAIRRTFKNRPLNLPLSTLVERIPSKYLQIEKRLTTDRQLTLF